MSKLFIVPRNNEELYENFISPVYSGVPREEIIPYLTTGEANLVGNRPRLFLWGVQESLKEKVWDKVGIGDWAMFYGSKKFFAIGKIYLKKYDPSLRSTSWPKKNEESTKEGYPYLVFVDNLHIISLAQEEFVEDAGYSKSFYPAGFMLITEEHEAEIIKRFGSIDDYVENLVSNGTEIEDIEEEENIDYSFIHLSFEQIRKRAEAYEDSIIKLETKTSASRRRQENRIQKRRIARLEDYTCQICGFRCEYETKKGRAWIIEVDHIIPKMSSGGERMKNLWALCPNCHEKKTRGIIVIDPVKKEVRENGRVVTIRDSHLDWYPAKSII